jgi:DNA-binding NtrC family response regulator
MVTPRNSVDRDRLLSQRVIATPQAQDDETHLKLLEILDQILIGNSRVMRALKELIIKYARYKYTVVITGESGSGKELIARALHRLSTRCNDGLLCLNCGAIPESIAESEFSGYVKGAFTGAITNKKGVFEAMDRGTLFLDEFSNLPITLQKKLLRIIEAQVVLPLGSTVEIAFDARIIIGTNRNLSQMASNGEFQFDLYQRVAVLKIASPPLRERLEDLAMLSTFLLENETALSVQNVDDEALAVMCDYDWPGNVRELKHILIQASIDAAADLSLSITASHVLARIEAARLEASGHTQAKTAKEMPFRRFVFETEPKMSNEEAAEQFLTEVNRRIQEANGNFSKAAEAMGYRRAALYNAVARAKENKPPRRWRRKSRRARG